MEVTKSLRYRINITRGMTGKCSWEATVDAEGITQDEILTLSDNLVVQLEKRYPAEITKKEKES